MKENKIILDLCGGTQSWSQPYVDAGYDVRLVTTPDNDVRTYVPAEKVYGILAAPPCPQFSFARTNAKTERDLEGAMELVIACLKIIWQVQYNPVNNYAKYTRLKFWALENPYYGLLKNFIGRPVFVFDPWEFGDGYQKRTSLWGNFNEPEKFVNEKPKTKLIGGRDDELIKFDMLKSKDIHGEMFGKLTRLERRSITPQGFAEAFFKANK